LDLAAEVDAYIEERGDLTGLMIQAESFSGWEDFEEEQREHSSFSNK